MALEASSVLETQRGGMSSGRLPLSKAQVSLRSDVPSSRVATAWSVYDVLARMPTTSSSWVAALELSRFSRGSTSSLQSSTWTVPGSVSSTEAKTLKVLWGLSHRVRSMPSSPSVPVGPVIWESSDVSTSDEQAVTTSKRKREVQVRIMRTPGDGPQTLSKDGATFPAR